MSQRLATQATRIPAGDWVRYDGLEISFHWATALIVIVNWTLAQTWDYAQRGSPLRHGMQSLHVSLGILLAAIIVARLLWRLGPGRRLPPADTGLAEIAARFVHYALYALLVTLAALGFCFRWAQHEAFTFFGLFSIPSPYPFPKAWADQIGGIHELVANTIIILAGMHAAAALFHHFVLHDGVLRRMLPGRQR